MWYTKPEREVDARWPLDVLQHGRRLPPGEVVEVMEVGQVVSRVSTGRIIVITHIARLGRSADTGLSTVELRLVSHAARVGRLDRNVERRVDERRVTALSPPRRVVART